MTGMMFTLSLRCLTPRINQGPDFESRTIKELCVMAGIQKTRMTPYHPKGNPVERFNSTLLQMLGTLNNKDKSHWRDYVKPLVHSYNCTKHEVTGFAPYELMFGRKPRLTVDLAFELPVNDQSLSHSQYVQNLKDRLKESYALCSKNAQKPAAHVTQGSFITLWVSASECTREANPTAGGEKAKDPSTPRQ